MIIIWINIKSNDKSKNGDYYTSTGKVNIESDEYLFEFVLEEYSE